MYEYETSNSSKDSELSEIERELDQMEFSTEILERRRRNRRNENMKDKTMGGSVSPQIRRPHSDLKRARDSNVAWSPPDVLIDRVNELEKMMDHLKLQPSVLDSNSNSRPNTPRKLHLVTQETATEEDESVDLRSQNERIMQTLSLVNDKNRELRNQVDSLQIRLTESVHEIELLKSTIVDLENQRKIDQATIARNLASSIIEPAAAREMRVSRTSVTPPWATHEDVDNFSIQRTQQVNFTPLPSNPEPYAAVSMTARLESDLLQLNLERQQVESWLGRVPPATATVADRKETQDKYRQLDNLERSISEIKAKLRARKLRSNRAPLR
jgi:hypothetical protein